MVIRGMVYDCYTNMTFFSQSCFDKTNIPLPKMDTVHLPSKLRCPRTQGTPNTLSNCYWDMIMPE